MPIMQLDELEPACVAAAVLQREGEGAAMRGKPVAAAQLTSHKPVGLPHLPVVVLCVQDVRATRVVVRGLVCVYSQTLVDGVGGGCINTLPTVM